MDGADGVEVEVLHASYDVPGARLLDLVTVMDRLRRECPWDREQTHRSLAPYLLEETHETLEALDTLDPDGPDYTHLREELGDLLLQVYFHARVASESPDGFTIDDVAAGIVDKLVRRHPHVFGEVEVSGAGEVLANWDAIKRGERGREPGVFGEVPENLPALLYARKLLRRATSAGRPTASAPEALDRVEAEAGRLREGSGREESFDAVGRLLLAAVEAARAAGVDPELALRSAAAGFREEVQADG